MSRCLLRVTFLFFNDTATTEIYTLSLHDALPISIVADVGTVLGGDDHGLDRVRLAVHVADRDLRLSIRPQVVGAPRLPELAEPHDELVSEGDRQRHQLGRLGARIAGHEALVAGAEIVHA